MSEPFLAEIKIVGFNFAPRGWAFCDGQVLPINQNQSLYSLLGTTYGGDGRTTFALPELRGRAPIHKGPAATGGTNHNLGSRSGEETHTLSAAESGHTHSVGCQSADGNQKGPSGNVSAKDPSGVVNIYSNATTAQLAADAVTTAGGGQSHNNMQPYQTLNFCIALVGLFPSRN